MNKALILVLALCLVSVHGFVKRDAPAPSETPDGVQKIKDFGAEIQNELGKVFNAENIKKNFNEAIETASKLFDNLKPTEPPKAKK